MLKAQLSNFFDIILGVNHRPTGEKKDDSSASEHGEGTAPPPKHNFLLEMRKYMPGPHRRFLEDVTKVANIRDYVEMNRDDHELTLAFDACLATLHAFRAKHIKIVSRYIIVKSRESRSLSRSKSPETQRRKVDIATASRRIDDSGKKNLKGTGGTALIPFLKQARDETGERAVEDWARRILNRDSAARGKEDFFAGKMDKPFPGEIDKCGLAGTWTDDENGGGLCHY